MKNKSLTQLKKEIYLRNVAKRWKSELATTKKVYILSPYITSNTAENVLENTQNCEIYTVFNIENFLTGTSSIRTLKTLIKRGFKVYDIPQLHSKIILVEKTFVSIGSQNLTNQGTRSKEATFTSTSLEVVKFIENELKQNWFIHRRKISLEMIEDTEEKIRPLKKIFQKLKKDVAEIEQFVDNQENQREIERNKKYEYEKRIAILKATIKKIPKAQKYIIGSVKNIESQSNWLWQQSYSNVWTFLPDSKFGTNLLNWRIVTENKTLDKTYYYLSLIENTGKIGWARVMKTRITHFQQGIGSIEIVINRIKYELAIIANWDWNAIKGTNLIVILSKQINPNSNRKANCEIHFWFDSNDLDVVEIFCNGLEHLKTWIEENEESFKELLIERILKPFKYVKNLSEHQADKFLEKKLKYRLRLGEIDNFPLLLFSER